MKKKNMINLYKNLSKIKYSMVDRWSIIDDDEIIRELVENITDVKEKDVDKMVETILQIMKNDLFFVEEIENEIIKRVKKMICNKRLSFDDMLLLLNNSNVIESKVAYYHELEKNLSQKDGKMHSYITIPISSNNKKELVIEFNVLEKLLQIYNSEIKITNIYTN